MFFLKTVTQTVCQTVHCNVGRGKIMVYFLLLKSCGKEQHGGGFNYFCALSFHGISTFKCAIWKHDPDRLCVNMSDRDVPPRRRVQVIKHRTDSGAAVKGPCSSQNGHQVKE